MQKYVKVEFKSLSEDAKIFEYVTKGAACADIYSNEEIIIPPFKPTLVSTGISVAIPNGFEMQLRCRSGLATKGIMLANGIGTIDSDYRGEIKVILTNITSIPFTINKGDRIAQANISPVIKAVFEEVEELSSTERNTGGFGSTGKN